MSAADDGRGTLAEPAPEDDIAASPFYNLRVSEKSPDPRVNLELALETVADQLRDVPTVPADPADATLPDAAALQEDCAVQRGHA